jgi:hypothetical protein
MKYLPSSVEDFNLVALLEMSFAILFHTKGYLLTRNLIKIMHDCWQVHSLILENEDFLI